MHTSLNVCGIAIGVAPFWLIFLYVADEIGYDHYNLNADRIVRVVQRTRWNGNDLHQALTSASFAGFFNSAGVIPLKKIGIFFLFKLRRSYPFCRKIILFKIFFVICNILMR